MSMTVLEKPGQTIADTAARQNYVMRGVILARRERESQQRHDIAVLRREIFMMEFNRQRDSLTVPGLSTLSEMKLILV